MKKEKYKIGIIGAGFCGTACEIGFESIADICVYDKYKNTESLETAVEHSDIIFVCLPTPMDSETGECKTNIIKDVIEEISLMTNVRKLIVIKSTVPPGTTDDLQTKYQNFTFVFNPEFLTEANFIKDFENQDRIIIGLPEADNKHSSNVKLIENFYNDFTLNQKYPGEIFFVKNKEAEMAKYIGNCFLATKVIFFNEMYEICKSKNIDYKIASFLATKDKRIGMSHTTVPGKDGQYGFGGKCLPKDLNSLIYFAKENNVDPLLLESVWLKNILGREKQDWLDIPGATTTNLIFNKKK